MMLKSRLTFLLCLLCLPFASCGGGWTTFRTGSYKGTRYELQSRSRSGMFASTNSIDWRIKLGSLPAVPVDAVVTDWGPPYSTDVYGTDSYLFLPGADTAYQNEAEKPGDIGVFHTMLYISPKTLSEEQFETFYHFMRDEWPRIKDSVTGKDPRDFPDIIGLVYGKQEKFQQEFHGVHGGKKMVLRIEPDGRVRLVNDDKWAQENWSGLSQKVQMPGKRLVLDGNVQNGGLTREELKAFRNGQGVAVDKFFDVIGPLPAPPKRE